MRKFTRDFRFAIRTLAKSPGFCVVAVGSLALGIGANTAIFTLTDQLLLRLLPIKQPEQLVMLDRKGSNHGSNTGSNAVSFPMYQDIRDRNTAFSGMFCRYQTPLSLSAEGKTQRVTGELVSGNFFPVLGVGAAAGRVFNASDDLHQGGHPYGVLSYSFWKSQFGGDRSVIGQKFLVNNYPITIIGVSEKGFDGIDPSVSPQIRIPMMMKKAMTPGPWYSLNDRRSSFAQVFGRLKPGVSLAQAKAGLQPLYHQILAVEVREQAFAKASAYSRDQFLRGWVNVLPAAKGRSRLRSQFQNPLLVLMAVVGFVLLIACANLANLLIARASARQKEIAIRMALGASRGRLVRQLLVECCVLSLAGGALGLVLAVAMAHTLISFIPQGTTPITLSATPDWRIFGFAFAVSLATALLFGLIPALLATRPDIAVTLKSQAAAVVGGGSVRLRKALVVAQVTLSLLLLVGSGLFVKTLKNLKDTDPGFRIDRLVSLKIDPPRNGYSSQRALTFYREMQERMNAVPGVKSASLAVVPLLDGDEWDSSVTVEGYRAKQGEDVDPHMNYIAPGFFSTLAIPIRLGRDFTVNDQKNSPKVAIVNETFANRYFKGQTPVGRHIGMGSDPGTPTDITVIAVVKDTKYENLRDRIPPEVYVPYTQTPFSVEMTAYARTEREPEQAFSALRQVVRGMDFNLPIYEMRTLSEQVERSVSTESLVATLSTVFGLLATFLAAIGLYGVMAYTVTQRTREIGIRMALGADRGRVIWLVMREVLILLGVGVALGAPAALGLTRLVQSQLYGVAPHDPITLITAVIVIALTAAFAGYTPGKRATRIHPMEALRWE